MATYVSKQSICKYIDERLNTYCLNIYEASIILRWMLGQTPQHPNKTKLGTQNIRVLWKARRLTTDSGVLSWINTCRLLIWDTWICIMKRCRPTGISTLNVRVCELEC